MSTMYLPLLIQVLTAFTAFVTLGNLFYSTDRIKGLEKNTLYWLFWSCLWLSALLTALLASNVV